MNITPFLWLAFAALVVVMFKCSSPTEATPTTVDPEALIEAEPSGAGYTEPERPGYFKRLPR
jgi:hypothetical protein